MGDPEVIRWQFGDVAARLLGGRTQPNPPSDWLCWKEPTPALSIDDQITSLIRRNAHPRLRSRSELDPIACPYYGARFAIAVAVDAATATAGADPTEMAKRCRVQEEAARQATEAIATISETLLQSSHRPEPRLPRLKSPELIGAYKTALMLRQMGTFERIAADARQWQTFYQRARGEPFDTWRLTFVAELGFAWATLTGVRPARNEWFADFIADAYASIADDEVWWDRAIRRAVALDLDWLGRGMSFAEAQKLFLGQP